MRERAIAMRGRFILSPTCRVFVITLLSDDLVILSVDGAR